MNQLTHIEKIYNGNETIIKAGYTAQSRFIVPMLARMVVEKLIPQRSMDVIQTILTFKHTENNPFPTQATIARFLGKSEVYVRKAVASIKKAGILGVKKLVDSATGEEKQNNEYDFTPFFALLEKFIIKFSESKDGEVKVADLLNVKVVKKSEELDFSWSEDYKAEEKVVVPTAPPETVQDASESTEEVDEVTLPEEVQAVLTTYSVKPEGISAVKQAYKAFGDKLHVKIFVSKIMASKDKNNFVSYFEKCILEAYTNNEQPKQQQPVQQPNTYKPAYSRKANSTENTPDWFDKDKAKEEAEKQALAEAEARKSFAEKVNGCDSDQQLNEFIAGMSLTDEQQAVVEVKRSDLKAEFERQVERLNKKLEDLYSDKQEGAK